MMNDNHFEKINGIKLCISTTFNVLVLVDGCGEDWYAMFDIS